MSRCRIALANIPFPASPDESVSLAVAAISAAGESSADLVCFPECYVPGYRAPHKRQFLVAGRNGKATIQGQLVNMRDGGFISQHDFHIASLIAGVVTGGDIDAGSLVTEEYLMALERKAFCSLIVHPKTQERIMGMLSTGKPLRN